MHHFADILPVHENLKEQIEEAEAIAKEDHDVSSWNHTTDLLSCETSNGAIATTATVASIVVSEEVKLFCAALPSNDSSSNSNC